MRDRVQGGRVLSVWCSTRPGLCGSQRLFSLSELPYLLYVKGSHAFHMNCPKWIYCPHICQWMAHKQSARAVTSNTP